jgi:hypothetical protein
MQDLEKLGSFYLGRTYDLAARKGTEHPFLYDSKDLVTHAICVGMTGSGKTGLCIGLLEEAAIDGIPSIIIDPKGDLSNLLLTFPGLKGADFRPWINEEDAAKKGLSPDAFADQQAAMWAKGLSDWGQSGARIQKLKDAAEFAVYTPGSNAGIGVSILKSFAAPGQAILDDNELFRDRVSTTATSLLGLIGVDADPIKSREHILLSTIFGTAWAVGKDLDLGAIIQQIQQPPVARIGVMEVESLFPAKERFALAMQINNILAAPGFASWMEGEALDIGSILHTGAGKPRVSIFSIAHLSDAERMFFVSLLLNQILGWVRTQSGTTSLRALLYMDEIAGYFPPVANPPSKPPLMTLMKQGRAFGFGVVLVTQNPVDIDYKGLSNAGTWFIGRLQTERDKGRVLDGLEGAAAMASAKFDRAAADKAMSQLGNRVFLMNNVHEDGPEIIESRWALSYLRGPLTKQQIKMLMEGRKGKGTSAEQGIAAAASIPAKTSAGVNGASSRPVLPADVPSFFVPIRGIKPEGATVRYVPMLLGCAKVYYNDPKAGVDQDKNVSHLAQFSDGAVSVDWDAAKATDLTESDVEKEPAVGASFAALPSDAAKAKSYEAWKKSYGDLVFRTDKLELLRSEALDETSRVSESERDFRVRLAQNAREQRDAAVEKLRQRFAPKTMALQDRIRRAEQAVEQQKSQATGAKIQTALSFGAAILGAFMGRKVASATNISKAATAARGVGRSVQESGDVDRAEENVGALQRQLEELNAQFNAEANAQVAGLDATTVVLDSLSLKPKRTNVTVRAVVLAWAPHWADAAGGTTAAF